jgi:PBP1b-binding outer membrane lipoprotein LpoB
MRNLIILIIAAIVLASCASAPIQKSEATAPVISAGEVQTAETQAPPEETTDPATEASLSEQSKKALKVLVGDDPIAAIMGWWTAGGLWFW